MSEYHITSPCLLLVFVKNAQLGKVKTRLAATLGNEEALRIYRLLLERTRNEVAQVHADVALFYADFIPTEPGIWEGLPRLSRQLQQGAHLGERMENAFRWAFEQSYKHVVIIGSDCPTMLHTHIAQAYGALENESEVTLGPARDGGYYLLGMNSLHTALFRNKAWSTSTVASETIQDCTQLGLNIHFLDTLNDIDDEGDWNEVKVFFDKE